MSDYEVKLIIKNARLMNKIREHGFANPSDFSKATSFNKTSLYQALSLKTTVYKKDFTVRVFPQRLADYFMCEPTDLFPEEVWYEAMEVTSVTKELSSDALVTLMDQSSRPNLEDLTDDMDLKKGIAEAMSGLSKRQQKIVNMRFRDEMTLAEIGAEFDVGQERIRQILARAMRQMRNPYRAKMLTEFNTGVVEPNFEEEDII